MIRFSTSLVFLLIFYGYCLAQPQLALEPIASGFTRPVKIANANDNRFFIAEIGGKIKILKNGNILSQPFSYQTNGYFYVMYVVKGLTEVQISRFSRSITDPDIADSNSEQKMLTIPYTDVLGGHRGGDLVFGKDGFLYASTGDNGPGSRGVVGDPDNNAQNPNSLFGKLLKLNRSDPLPLSATSDKVFAVGLRNPWRFSIDRANGDFWIGDNGQDGWEEVNYLRYPFENTAPNFGWSCFEGNQNYTTANCTPGTTYIAPQVVYSGYNNNGGLSASVMGGFVYRGSAYPSLKGYYFFGDYASGKIGFINTSGVTTLESGLTYESLISFGKNQSGELYLLSFANGTLSKLMSPNDPLPVKLVFLE